MSDSPPSPPVTPSPPDAGGTPPVTPSPPSGTPPVTPSPPSETPPVTPSPPPPVTPSPPPPETPSPPPPVTPSPPPPETPSPPPPVTPSPPPPETPSPPPPVTPPPPVAVPPVTPSPPVAVPPVTQSPPDAVPPVTQSPPDAVPPATQSPPVAVPPMTASPPKASPPLTASPPEAKPPVIALPPGPSPTLTPTPVFPPPPPPPVPRPTPITPSPFPPRPPSTPTPTPTPVTPSPPPPRPTPTPTPVTPSPPPPRPTPAPTPVTPSPPPGRPPTASPPPPANVPGSSPPPPQNDEPASASPPPSHPSLYPPPPSPQSGGAAPSTSAKSPSSSTGIGVGVAVGAVVLLGLAAVLIFCLVSKRRRRRRVPPLQQSHALPTTTTPSSTPPPLQSWQSIGDGTPGSPLPAMTGGTFGYDELAAATDGFSEANLLGQGGFGYVYKGTVRGQEVAIKKLRAGSGQGHREFRAEVDIISRVHHKNLVSLVGFCIHAEQRLLVYEYVPNKTLESHLHHGSGRAALDWPRRWKIAVGSAKGLAYLHEDCHPKIIHRDIKAANILLDYNYEPKVADFGLAKCQEIEQTAVSTRIMGTFGYLAPEYAATGKVTDRSDVFSFGVMLLELITGNKPIMTSSDDQPETLVAWAKPLLTMAVEEENYEDLIDPSLDTNYDAYEMARLVACAAAAVRQTARSRPRMTQIVRYLEGELSAEDLNAGKAPGQSAMHRSSGGADTDEVRRLRKMAFRPGSGTMSEYASSELSAPTTEYGLNTSSEYTASSAANTEDMTDASYRTGSGDATTGISERVSRRTTVSRQARRASRG